MQPKTKLFLVIGVFVIIVIAGVVMYSTNSDESSTTQTTTNTFINNATNTTNVSNVNSTVSVNAAIPPEEASSNIKESVDSIITGLEAESTQAEEDGITETTITSDSQALDSYEQSYDENEY